MMNILIYFHGSVFSGNNHLRAVKITHKFEQPLSVQNLITHYSLITNVKVSINEEFINDLSRLVNENDEIHFFRPVSGG